MILYLRNHDFEHDIGQRKGYGDAFKIIADDMEDGVYKTVSGSLWNVKTNI